MKAIIPAAGLGTRFLPMTKNSPKEMLPVVDKPAIQYVVEEAVNSGINDIVIVTGRGKEVIENHFDVAYELEKILEKRNKYEMLKEVRRIAELADIYYIRQKEPLGLGHAIYVARKHIHDEAFAVLLGDDIIISEKPCIAQLIEVHKKVNASIIGVKRVSKEDVSKYGIIKYSKIDENLYRIEELVEKPSPDEAPSDMAVMGRYVLMPKLFEYLGRAKPGKNEEIQLTDALNEMLQEEEIYAYEFDGKRYDLGNKLDWIKINVEMALKREEFTTLKDFLRELIKS
ncbi:MAG: UTP--glucose-1-phosphate uridylyltransferase GalU [Thermoplasmata archaeon]|nr:UTP--glucose-1-phosphate uridylyltransferase GalU [Thermoplasmata archaeon]